MSIYPYGSPERSREIDLMIRAEVDKEVLKQHERDAENASTIKAARKAYLFAPRGSVARVKALGRMQELGASPKALTEARKTGAR